MAELFVYLEDKPNKDLARICDAVTSVTIEYKKNGCQITVLANTPIKVDVANGIALINGDHVDIDFDEYVEVYHHNTAAVSRAN